MGLFRSASGTVRFVLTSADLPRLLGKLRLAGLELTDVEQLDPLRARLTLPRKDYSVARSICDAGGGKMEILEKRGLYWPIAGLYRRPVLVLGLTLLLALSLYLPGRILFVQVEGADTVPVRLIVEKASACGVHFWARAGDIRSEKVKNSLLSSIDGLRWVGVRIQGCVAVIQVRERQAQPQLPQQCPGAGLVAQRDGIICSVTVTRGTAKCAVGDAVRRGQLLISGYTDCTTHIRAEQAEGIITALTVRDLTLIRPTDARKRVQERDVTEKYCLIIGKKRINFYQGSGILDTSCAKIYEQWYLTLPGGFTLPLAIGREVWTAYAAVETQLPEEDLAPTAQAWLLDRMPGGEILHSRQTQSQQQSVTVFTGRYICREPLGVLRLEEISHDG